MAAIELNEQNFESTITGSDIVLVDFWAPWCGPCRMQLPVLEQVVSKIGERARVGKVNVDESRDLAVKFGIRSIPALMVFKDGKVVQQFVGLQQVAALVQAVESALK